MVSSCSWSWVDIEFIFVFKCLEFVCVSWNEDVHIKLPLEQSQAGHVTPGDHLVAVNQPDFELSNSHNFLLWIVQVLKRKKIKQTQIRQISTETQPKKGRAQELISPLYTWMNSEYKKIKDTP